MCEKKTVAATKANHLKENLKPRDGNGKQCTCLGVVALHQLGKQDQTSHFLDNDLRLTPCGEQLSDGVQTISVSISIIDMHIIYHENKHDLYKNYFEVKPR